MLNRERVSRLSDRPVFAFSRVLVYPGTGTGFLSESEVLVFHMTEPFRVSGLNFQTSKGKILVVILEINHRPLLDNHVWGKGCCHAEKEDNVDCHLGVSVSSILNLEGGTVALPTLYTSVQCLLCRR